MQPASTVRDVSPSDFDTSAGDDPLQNDARWLAELASATGLSLDDPAPPAAPAPPPLPEDAPPPMPDPALDVPDRTLTTTIRLVSELAGDLRSSTEAQERAVMDTARAIAGLEEQANAARDRADRTTAELIEAIVGLRATEMQTQEAVVELRIAVTDLSDLLLTAEGHDRLTDIEAGISAVYRAVRGGSDRPEE